MSSYSTVFTRSLRAAWRQPRLSHQATTHPGCGLTTRTRVGQTGAGTGSRAFLSAGAAAVLVLLYEWKRTRLSLDSEHTLAVAHADATARAEAGVPDDAGPPKEYLSLQEVAKHNLSQDAWVIINGKVYDVTNFHEHHPGGAAIIVSNAGTDVSALFNPLHPPGTIEGNLPAESFRGFVDPATTAKAAESQAAEKRRIAEVRENLPPVETILGLDEFQGVADQIMSKKSAEYYHGGALDGISRDDNKQSFRKCRIVPRVMRDVSSIQPQTTMFGVPSALPIYISPASNAVLGHPDGELNLTRGAARTGIVQGISYVASYPLSDILAEKQSLDEEMGEKMGMVYQVYVRPDRVKTAAMVREAIDGGCQALLLTVDSNTGDFRQSVEKMKGTTGSAEPGRVMGPITTFGGPHDPSLNWDDLEWLRGIAGSVPIYLKGVSDPEDIRIAQKHGVKGCILSNHGGRQLDRARTGFDSLRAIHRRDPEVLKEMEIYIDGGARRGTDVLMALALGAKGVGLGRPFLYAQAAYGEKGAIRAVRIIQQELVTAMQLMGVRKLDELRPEMVECLSELWR